VEYRDTSIQQLIHIRNAIYFVGLVIALTQFTPFIKELVVKEFGLSENINQILVFLSHLFLLFYSIVFFWRSSSSARYFDKRLETVDYGDS
jgi:hypothetical protein